MVVLARELTSRQLSFSVTAQVPPKKIKIPPAKPGKPPMVKIVEKAERMDLGTGDLTIPTTLAVSAYTLGGVPNIANAIAIILGSTVALGILLYYVSKYRVFLPALPPICLGGISALLLAKLVGF